MKKYTILVVFLFAICATMYSQSKDSTISVDLLSVPVTPAFTILGIEPTSIEEPTTPTDLLVSVRNSTGNFKNFPNDYALVYFGGNFTTCFGGNFTTCFGGNFTTRFGGNFTTCFGGNFTTCFGGNFTTPEQACQG